ncbi:hypothetical protein BRARA_A03199 [Brassica rapa]|uniref:Pectinesterase n=1 Tax=Brassica campestris TaxID=3711 RepID=A0A398AY02_BRACM|nr:hypothetical protein BRARA_A03199 [Brassica rapa]
MYRCTFQGFQDTCCTHAGNQLYRECYIIGIVDVIFGYAAAIFQSCNILIRKPLPNQINTPFATVLVMKMFLGDMVEPRSWITWNPRTLRYGEYKHTGTGSLRKGRQLVRKRLRLLSKGLSKGLPKLDERSFPYWFGPDDQKSLLTCQWIPNVTVASDGTGDFLTISEAVVKVPETGNSKFVIHVKGGLYRENMILPPKKSNVVMFGDGNTKTIVSAGLNRLDNPLFTTFQTATISVRGRGFVALDMKFVNTAGLEKNQAVAFHSMSTFSVMYRCTFEGFQDTLYAHAGDQFYRECDIVGTVDFIFGYAAAIFQSCNILSSKPLRNQINTITAQAASDQFAKSGFVIVNSTIGPYLGEHFTTYLGRPWKPFATVLVMETYLGDMVEPRGWIAWNKEAPPTTLRYGEFKNSGPGSGLGSRV